MKYFFILLSIFVCFHSYSNADEISQYSNNQQANTKSTKNHFDIKIDEKEGDHFLNEFMSMLTTLGIIVALVLIATWFLKKMVHSRIEQMNTTSIVKIIERRSLNPKTTIFLLDIKGQGVILADSANGVTRLGDFDINEKETEKPSFKEIMNNPRNGS